MKVFGCGVWGAASFRIRSFSNFVLVEIYRYIVVLDVSELSSWSCRTQQTVGAPVEEYEMLEHAKLVEKILWN